MAKGKKEDQKTYFTLVDWDSKAIIGNDVKPPKKSTNSKGKGQKK